MPKKVVIIGAGISGLVASYVFSKHENVETVVIENDVVCGEFLAGGLRYVRNTNIAKTFFKELDLAYSKYVVKGGILIRGETYPYPDYLCTLELDSSRRIQNDYFRKTRRMEPSRYSTISMNDPAAIGQKKALRCDFEQLVKELVGHSSIIKEKCLSIDSELVVTNKGSVIYYDYLVLTTPLWITEKLVPWSVPSSVAMTLTVGHVVPIRDEYSKWDYVYTPYTPGNSINRFSSDGDFYVVESNGLLNNVNFCNDLNFIFPDGWYLKRVITDLKGYMMSIDRKPELPDNVIMLGRYAQWDSNITLDSILKTVYKTDKEWFGEKC